MRDNKRIGIVFISGTIILMILIMVSIILGSVSISPSQIIASVAEGSMNTKNYNIIMNIRLPRIVSAVILGGALALSGYLLQTFFSNPIVGPFVLGISSGAKLAVAIAMIMFMTRGHNIGSMGMVIAAFIGSMTAMVFVLLISLKVKSVSALVVCGIMIGYICSAITDFVVTFADDMDIVNLHNWSMGSLSGMNWNDIRTMAVIVPLCIIASICISKPIGAYRLGETYARNMGVNIRMLRIMLILLASLLAASVTAFAGPISFVGIAVPHLMKNCIKTTKPLAMIPVCFLGGAIITLFCDGIARTVFAPTEVSISSVTAIFLVPVVIVMMIGKSRKDRV